MDNVDILIPREWARGISLGWAPAPGQSTDRLIGQVLYQGRIIPLDRLAYSIWSDALQGRVDFSRCGDPDYLPPGCVIEHQHTGKTASPAQIADTAAHLRDTGLLWNFDPNNQAVYQEAQRFEIAVQGVPLGNVERPDSYRIAHSDGSPALDIDGVAYMIWLRWWTDPTLIGAAHYVAHELGIRRLTVVGQAIATLLAGMRVGLLYIAGVHNA